MKDAKEQKTRCSWCMGDELYIQYHDNEWGVPQHDDRKHFEFLVLESAQAGLNWLLILKRREAYKRAYENWDVDAVADYNGKKRQWLLSEESGIVRNRLKIDASINNARRFLEVKNAFGTFDKYIWSFTNEKPYTPHPRPRSTEDIPAQSDLSRRLSKDLKDRGFRFVGPVICHSFLQAIGLIDEHMQDCFVAKAIDTKRIVSGHENK